MAIAAVPSALDERMPARHSPFILFAWTVLVWNLLVVLWGAYVRASGSGAGCGNHWPLCNGEIVPRAPQLATVIEFTHRGMSGVALVLIGALYLWAIRRFPSGHLVRTSAALSSLFIITEALLGAGLVLFKYVDHNESVGRALYLSAHLVNTQLLLAALAMTVFFAAPGITGLHRPWSAGLLAALAVTLVVSVSGAVAALGDSLYPASSLAGGIRQELSATASVLLRLRLLHPVLAILSGIYVAFASVRFTQHKRIASAVVTLITLQLCAGAMNVALLAPVWMQILHLLLADLLWITLVILFLRSHEIREI
jgi:cytochrome c oxidase assembly protein subunit 15